MRPTERPQLSALCNTSGVMSSETRDEFSADVKRNVADRVGRVCSAPDCGSATSGPQADPSGAVNVGVAAHITAASSGGPRYDATLSREQRSSIENAIWLCQTCARKVDHDDQGYPVEVLRAWKILAEHAAHHKLGKTKYVADFVVAEESRSRQLYALAIHLLRIISGEYFQNIAVWYWLVGKAREAEFWRTAKILGETDATRNRSRFTPFTNASSFHTDDRPVLKAAEKIVRTYVEASTSCPIFQEIKAQFDLPDPEDARSLLPKT